jgi:hypothetical protein
LYLFADEERLHMAQHRLLFRELAVTTKNFRRVCLLGEGGFGLVYKGHGEWLGLLTYSLRALIFVPYILDILLLRSIWNIPMIF